MAKAQQKPQSKPKAKKVSLKDSRLKVKVFSPYQVYYQGEAISVSAINKTGPFDVLVGHANFFSLLVAGQVVVRTGFNDLKFEINHGVMKVTNNTLTLFVDV